jgi:putative sigma-54 modulation protein
VQISISARHGHLSEATQERLTARLEKLTKYFERLTAVELTVDLERKDAPAVDLRVSAEHKHDFVATEQGAELMTALDAAIHKVEQQLRKYKEKVQDHHRTPGLRQQGAAIEADGDGDVEE